jgi:hypothetical protein
LASVVYDFDFLINKAYNLINELSLYRAGTAYPSGVPEFSPVIVGVRVARHLVVVYMSYIIIPVGNKHINKIDPSHLAKVTIGRNRRII